MQKWKLIHLECLERQTSKLCNVQSVNFLGKKRTISSASTIVRHTKRPTSSINATFAATQRLIIVVVGTTTACIATTGRALSDTNAKEKRIAL